MKELVSNRFHDMQYKLLVAQYEALLQHKIGERQRKAMKIFQNSRIPNVNPRPSGYKGYKNNMKTNVHFFNHISLISSQNDKCVIQKLQRIYAQYMFNICSIYFQYMFNIFSIYAQYMFNICSIYFQYMLNICSIYAQYMFNNSFSKIVPFMSIAGFTLDAELLARSQHSEGPATGHLDTHFSWFPCVYKQMLRWFPRFQVATTCFSRNPPDLNLNLSLTSFIFCLHVR